MGSMGTIHEGLRSFIGKTHQLLIDGVWQEASDRQTFTVENPADGDMLGRVAHGRAADIDKAVSAARKAFDGPWSKLSASE